MSVDPGCESEIEAIVDAQEPIEDSDAVEVLEMSKQDICKTKELRQYLRASRYHSSSSDSSDESHTTVPGSTPQLSRSRPCQPALAAEMSSSSAGAREEFHLERFAREERWRRLASDEQQQTMANA